MAAESSAYIALGANLGDVKRNLRRAIETLDATPGCRVTGVSPWYRSRAIGPGNQPDYLNGVMALATTLDPHALLDLLQALEAAAGRERMVRWGARTLDLDLLLFDELSLADERLTLPHPRLAERNFVVYPLSDLAPALHLPDGTPVSDLRIALGARGLEATFATLEQSDD